MLPRNMLVALSSVFLLFQCCNSMIEKYSTSIGHEVRTLHQFKYEKGGSLQMQVRTQTNQQSHNRRLTEDDTTSAHTLRLYHCTDKELNGISSYHTIAAFCAQIESFSCTWSGFVDDVSELTVESDFVSTKTQTLTMLAVNCDENGYKYQAQYHFVAKNGNNEYLSLTEIPYKQIYILLAVIWGVIGVLWIAHWLRYKEFNVKYHQAASFYPILKCASCVAWHFFWIYCSHEGVESPKLTFAVKFMDPLTDGYLFLSLMLLAEGWNWLRYGLESNRQYMELVLWFVVFVGSAVASYYCMSLTVVVALMLVLCLYRILGYWMSNMRDLKGQKDMLEMECPQIAEDNDAPINIKISILESFQKAVAGFLIAEIVFQFVDTLFVEHPWINTFLSHCILMVLVCYLGFCIRMRPFRPGFYVTEYKNDGTVTCEFPKMWRPGMPAPVLPKSADYDEWLHMSETEITVLSTDIDTDAQGMPIENFSLLTPISYDIMTKTYHPHHDKERDSQNSDKLCSDTRFSTETDSLL